MAIILIFLLCFYPTFILSTDESSLLTLKSRIINNSGAAVLSTNWTEKTSFCTWIGVTCSRRHPRVTSLNLSGMGLEGTIPEEIGSLSFLTFLDVSNNSFSGEIPARIGNLTRLRVLKMSKNQLEGQVPSSLGFLRNLEMLDLADNKLNGNIPWQDLFNISSLKVIAFTRNYQLSGAFPIEINCGAASRLEQIRISLNQFGGDVPESLSRCRQLTIISFSYNNFTGSLTGFENLPQLRILALAVNQFSGTISPSIGNLSNLEILDLSVNLLHGIIPSEIEKLSNLNFISLGENMLTGELPISIFNLTKLDTLSLPKNNLVGTLPISIDKTLPNLRLLYLGNNLFSGKIPYSISNLSKLTIFDVYNNSFTGIIPTNLGNLEQLQVLRLGMNQFTNDLSVPEEEFITSLTNCENLAILEVPLNPITGVLPKSIGSGNFSASLEQFVIYSCRLKGQIPEEIGNLKSLIWLSLGDNEFTGEIPLTLGRLNNMQKLEIYGTNLHGSIPQSFCSLENLYYLSLGRNGLSGNLPTCLGNLSSLREIYLEDNGFISNIPSSFWSLQRIQIFSLFNNSFNGSLSPEIANLKGVHVLKLHGNRLSGDIPTTIGQLENLVNLSLSDNMLHGSIPESLANLKLLQYMDLSRNNISGPIPKSLETLSDLSYFNVSFNELSGEIPQGGRFANFTAELFQGNKGLCGEPRFNVEACNNTTRKSSSGKSKLLKYILIPIVCMLVITTIIILLLTHYRRRSSVLSDKSDLAIGLTHERISYYEILRATRNLDEANLIGKGSIGSVYKGTFSNRTTAAIKIFNLDVQGAFKSFDTECQIMCGLRHRNLVKVITSCSNLDFKALVVEYMRNGGLDEWLYSPKCTFDIAQRLRIMIEVASAMEYLHRGYSSPIIHCDLKPSNILLDENLIAHVGDFGISKLFSEDQRIVQTKTLGTIGYMAPEYGSSGLVSTAVDVYSYGILLMETFTRKKPTNEMFIGDLTMKNWVLQSFPDALNQIVDAQLLNTDEEYSTLHLESIMRIAIDCTSEIAEERPNMGDVLAMLNKINVELHETKTVLLSLPYTTL
ncbi:hypothetical protein ABFX02_13G036100 [Erythranthe guttata]